LESMTDRAFTESAKAETDALLAHIAESAVRA